MEYGQALWIYLILLFGIIVVPGMDMFFVLTNALTRPAGPHRGVAMSIRRPVDMSPGAPVARMRAVLAGVGECRRPR